MSYILDAIRKSDQQRRRGVVPTLPTAPTAAVRRPALMFYGLLGLAFLVVGIGIGWLSPWRPAPSDAASGEQPHPPRAEAGLPPRAPLPTNEASYRREPTGVETQVLVPPAARQEQSSSPAGRTSGIAAPAAKQKQAAVVAQDAPAHPDTADGAAEQNIVARSDLPLPIQQELPAMSVAMHVYSDQARDRLVSVNNRVLREGDYLATDLKLEQITADGMIFSYRGYRFRHGVK